MRNPGERERWGAGLADQAARLKDLGRELAGHTADLAGRIAETGEEVARVHEQIASSGVSTTSTLAHWQAERARAVAEHERREQQRWQRRAR